MQKHTLLQSRPFSVILRANRGSEQQHNYTEETQRKSKIKIHPIDAHLYKIDKAVCV